MGEVLHFAERMRIGIAPASPHAQSEEESVE